jgi:S-adenosylmethionine:tRNA ribosyltransferase-isomerase
MHAEAYDIPLQAAERINTARVEGRRIVALGTTVTRTLEHAVDARGLLQAGQGETSLFIKPGHQFRMVDALVTNFHLPKSTLLVLVSAFAGREFILQAYREAVQQAYRFFSYGDCMLIE